MISRENWSDSENDRRFYVRFPDMERAPFAICGSGSLLPFGTERTQDHGGHSTAAPSREIHARSLPIASQQVVTGSLRTII